MINWRHSEFVATLAWDKKLCTFGYCRLQINSRFKSLFGSLHRGLEQVQAGRRLPTPGEDGTDPQPVLSVLKEEQIHNHLPMGAEGTLVPEADEAHNPVINQDSEQLANGDRPGSRIIVAKARTLVGLQLLEYCQL